MFLARFVMITNPPIVINMGAFNSWEAAKVVAAKVPGWHLPSDEEWTVLTNYLGTNVGTRLKSGGDSGFEALLAGSRLSAGRFYDLGSSGVFWSSSPSGTGGAWRRYVSRADSGVSRSSYSRGLRFSVRLLKD